MNQIVTNPKNSKTTMQVKNHKLKARLVMRMAFLALCAVLFALPAKAQLNNVYMHTGSQTVPSSGSINFYDAGGPSAGPAYYWERWFLRNEDYTFTFNPAETGKKVKVTFNEFTAYLDNGGYNHAIGDNWSLRLNTAELSIYDGTEVNEQNLITTYTGNMTGAFSVIANGPITFRFQSYGYREEGWQATVQCVDNYELQKPQISFEACSDAIVINANNKGADIYYTTDGNDPDHRDVLANTQRYEGPFHVEAGTTIKAIVKVGSSYSTVAAKTFTADDVTPTPGEPTISREGNTITMTPADISASINETYYVWYTDDGVNPSPTHGTRYTGPIVCTTPNKVFMAVTRAESCENKISSVVTYNFGKVKVPDPTIAFTVVDEEGGTGKADIACQGYTIIYTTNGTTPVASATGGTNNSVTIEGLTPGTTVRAIAFKLKTNEQGQTILDPDYDASEVVTKTYLPGGEGSSGVYGGVVLLDDREDHNWSYYSMGGDDNPVHSLNPADVKITYYGFGANTMTNDDGAYEETVTVDDVAVGPNTPGDRFVYLKTLENAKEDGTGNYPYTLIPNPFSKRPTYGDGNSKWRGFAGWRVKRLSGVTITGYAVDDVIPAETEIEFVTENAEGNEVEFEAMWAQAYVNTTNSATGLDGGSYELNFIVGAAPSAALSVPVTYSSYNPDGTGGATTVNIGTFSCSADTKFEYMNLNNGTLTANNHDLIMGRGLTGTAAMIQGINGNANNGLDYMLRVESGTYDELAFVRSSGCTVSGRYLVRSILGCDYDRAEDENDNLIVSEGRQLFFSQNVTFSGSVNKDQKTFDLVVKSGSFQSDYWNDHSGNADYVHSMYLGQNSAGNTYPGGRYVVVEGGEFASINGGRGVGSTSTTYCDPNFLTFNLRVKGGLLHGVIYGGAADNPSIGSRRIVITGGTINGWVAAGANGTGGVGGSNAQTNGNSYVYVGGNSTIGGTDVTINNTPGGNVFGAGRGNTNQKCSVMVAKVVVADNTTIHQSVYGGGFNGYTEEVSNVYVLGGTVMQSVYGGGYNHNGTVDGAPKIIPTSNVYVNGGTVNGSVYGGSNSSGTVNNSHVTMTAGTTENVFGGGYGEDTNIGESTDVNISGGTINNNVYGGGDAGTVTGNTNVNVSGGTMKDVYGAGKGGETTALISGSTNVVVSGGAVANVYGGGENGDVGSSGNQAKVVVTLGGSTYNNTVRSITVSYVDSGNPETKTLRWRQNLEYGDNTFNVDYGSVFRITDRAGQNSNNPQNYTFTILIEGEQAYSSNLRDMSLWSSDVITQPEMPAFASTVTVSGGSVSGEVYGGGKMGKTSGNTMVNVEGNASIRGNVFGGAYGASGSVFVAGQHTVNVMGGHVFGNVYGGSRNANDALAFDGEYETDETKTSSAVNISAGRIDEQVYAAGYFGQTFGSVYVFVGREAILNAPHKMPSFGDDNEQKYKAGIVNLSYNIWAGSDFGTFSGGTFSAPSISGYSDIYVDGNGYNTQTNDESAPTYMNIKGSLLGSGTSGDAGKQGRGIYVRNYGSANSSGSKDDFNEPFTDATRTFYAIQRADTLVIDNSHINFTGQAKINSLDATEKYAIYSFDKTVRMTGGSSIFMNAPVYQIIDFWSATVDDLYKGINAVYSPIAYNGLGAAGGPIDNKVRVNGGNYIEVYHDKMPRVENGNTVEKPGYGMLNGFAHMMVASDASDNTCAYARPKQCDATPIDAALNNPNDGGWVSYDSEKNTFDIAGHTVSDGSSDQMPYENHTTTSKAGEQYFRIWRVGGEYSEREGVLNAKADGTDSFDYVDVTIKLPAWRSNSAYYKFETSGTGANLNTTIDYGADVMTYATAIMSETEGTQNWVHFVESTNQQTTGLDATAQTQIESNPNINFGLVTIAGDGMTLSSPVQSQGGLIVCPESDEYLASVGEAPDYATVNKFTCSDNTVEPQVTFRLTYSNKISTNMTWDPMFVTLVQCDANGNVTDRVKISLTINTYTTINNEFTTQTYALMDGQHGAASNYTAKVTLPKFTLHDYAAEHLAQFFLTDVVFTPANEGEWLKKGSTYDMTKFAMQIQAARNEDNSDGWNGSAEPVFDPEPDADFDPTAIPEGGYYLGQTGARTPFAFDFILTYNGQNVFTGTDEQAPLGVLTFKLKFNNYAEGDPDDDYSKELTIKVQVIRRGVGKVFYLDGQNGSNSNSALFPNDAALSLSYIYNRCGFMPGDIIYIVNEVDVNKNLEWSGTAYGGVTLYRYPGGHPLVEKQRKDADGNLLYWTDETHTEITTTVTQYPVMDINPIVDNPDNEAYTGALLEVGNKGNLTMHDIVLDGHMTDRVSPYSTEDEPLTDAGVTAAAPMITIASGGTVEMNGGAVMQHNHNTTNGGAVAVNDGGTLKMNNNATITNNLTNANGGAVYMAGTMIVSDSIQIKDNLSGSANNNVYLSAAKKVIQIGTSSSNDAFGPLTADARIGVTKTLYADVEGYTEIVYVEDQNEREWLELPYTSHPNAIIYHDGGMYQLEKYKDPQFLYWIGTWVTVQYWNPEYASDQVEDYDPDDFEDHLDNIDTPQELAWLISYVNGLNGATAHPNAVATITADIDMQASIWVPIGNNSTPYTGTFEGNGHVVTGIHSLLVNDNAGMFGVTNGATIQDVVAVVEFDGNSINKGTFIGTMVGGTLANVEAAGELVGKANTVNMGGLVGLATTSETITTKPTIHSSFAVNTLTAEKAETVVGGLVGSNGGNLYNSYANVTLGDNNVATTKGGLVGVNQEGCTVENCYVINPIGPAFAATNNGVINYCYAANGINNFVGDGTDPEGSGNYGTVLSNIKDLGYMYGDNLINKNINTYVGNHSVTDEGGLTEYIDNHIPVWNGLLSALNQWVRGHEGYTPWNRPINNAINGDLPILAFPKDQSLATLNSNGKFLQYSTGLDNLLEDYTDPSGIFVYGAVTGVENVPANENVKVTIAEDAVLLQADNAGDFKATVGVTFDNSDHGQHAVDNLGEALEYDWHMMSTPLQDAAFGTTYNPDATLGYGQPVDIASMVNGYFPNALPMGAGYEEGVKWDFYTYYEPQYHWINFKRSIDNHWHYDEINHTHPNIPYAEADQTNGVFTPGKGYMMAISQDSYMNSTGKLNNRNVTITLTNAEPDGIDFNKGWNLVGNPYQAYLSMAPLGALGYKAFAYNADLGVYSPFVMEASENPATLADCIHPHQAFFVYTATDGTQLVFDKTTMATTEKTDNSYFRGDKINYPLVNIFAENERGNRDMTIIEFNRPEIGGAPEIQGLRNADFHIAAHLEGQGYGLLFAPEGTDRVPVRFYTNENGTFTLTWETMHGNFTSLLLVDNMTGTITDMLHADHYTFDATTDDYASRFYITFAVTDVEEYNEGDNDFAWFDGSEWVINGKGNLDVVDVLGRTIYSTRLTNDQNRVNLNNVAKGVYMLRVSEGTSTKVQKVVVR